ncbi:uncharacterized protein LOC107265049 isoform X2 [Cephus cinctus]|uniref:Uncharacterized protein LOC107265049 isoform X2 n=1 Tax=Cephus cinctus TaxID=211228 RepID=A0AAJ7BM89_CEPCN|nr:uncharacterized protein LOC107265049 isoform X2 [Cephus cinctus]
MKNVHPVIVARTASPVGPSSSTETSPEPVIRLRLDKPLHWAWELTTSADKLPLVQLLDKDGRLLVETTGRTAQRARGSFKDGVKSHEKMAEPKDSPEPEVPEATSKNRNIDGFSSKYGASEFACKPRKSRSDANVSFAESKGRKIKKRHSTGVEASLRKMEAENDKTSKVIKRYSAGDYLRQQILDDLQSSSNVGKTAEEIAEDRCKKVQAYLNSQRDNPERSGRDEKLRELKDYLISRRKGEEKSESKFKREELQRIKGYLQDKIKAKMVQEKLQSSSSQPSVFADTNREKSQDVRKRHSEYLENDRKNYRTRKVRSDVNIRFDPEVYERERLKSSKRNSSARSERRPRDYVRSRSDVVLENLEIADSEKVKKRNSSGSDKRKVYRKTKSDVLLSRMADSVDSEKDFQNSLGRKNSTDSMERSWREYKERKRHERLHRESGNGVPEEDFMSRPRWKDFQTGSCCLKNCRVCQNFKFCTSALAKERDKDAEASMDQGRGKDSVKDNTEFCNIDERADVISVKDSDVTDGTTDLERPASTLQENYLLLEPIKSAAKAATISKLRVSTKNFEDDGSKLNSPDFGYNSITKNGLKDYKELYANSTVKKSDTFKIVDGSEDIKDCQIPPVNFKNNPQWDTENLNPLGKSAFHAREKDSKNEKALTPQSNEDIARDYFRRVYELLKKRQEDAKILAEGSVPPGYEDTSSSNCIEQVQRKRRRRKKKDSVVQGEEVVAVRATPGERDSWSVQRLLGDEPPSLRLCRGEIQDIGGSKRPRHPPPPSVTSCKVNARDISKYFDSPNKENSPGYGVNGSPAPREQEDRGNLGADMGSNLSRHNGKGLTGRRTQSSGNLCEPKGKLSSVGKILVPCSSEQKDRYKFCGSLPNHLDGKETLDDDPGENNNVIPDTIAGNLGGTLPHKKRTLGVHFSDGGPTGTLDLVKHRSQDSLDDNPWRYRQSNDLDLVRCKHGNFDLVRRNQSTDAVDGDSSKKYIRGLSLDERCHRSADLDLVGALPKKRQDSKANSHQGIESGPHQKSNVVDNVDDDLLMKLVHKPDCELMKHRHLSRGVDLKLSKLSGGEPQDQGYASERSPEDEHPPSLPGQPFPSVTPESTFRVTLQKSSRGLGLSVSGGGTAGPVRVKRLFPQQPAALSNKLQPGDILLAANGIPLTGLTNYEALEVLRTTPSTVELVVCRPPGDATITPPGAPPPPPARREPPPPLRILNPLPPLQIEPCGEFDIEMTKVAGSLGFTLRKADSSALGHYVRALVREPALSDGRIQPGDKIVAVDGAPLSPMSHEEAVALLRQCGPRVRLRLYRDLAQTPVSALSPTEPDHPLRPPRTSLRQEAVDMLCDLAVRKLSPGTSSGSSCRQSPGASCSSPRRLRRPATRTPTAENEQAGNPQKYYVTQMSTTTQVDTSDSDQCSIKTQITNSQPNTPVTDIIDPPPLYDVCDSGESKPPRPKFLDLSAAQATECDYDDLTRDVPALSSDEQDTNLPSEPASMPPVLSSTSSTSTAFSYKNPAYQSANPACGSNENSAKNKAAHSSDQDIPGKVLGTEDPAGSKGLLKWKGVMFTPSDSVGEDVKYEDEADKSTEEPSTTSSAHEQENQVFMVELTRGWNSRLGFSLQPEGNRTVISVVHADSVAAKDGRLKQGDVLIMVNDESVEHMSTSEIIDLLRKIRGSIGITVMRRNKCENAT